MHIVPSAQPHLRYWFFILTAVGLLVILVGGRFVSFRFTQSGPPYRGPTPISAVRQAITRQYRNHVEIVDSFHALTTRQVGEATAVVFQIKARAKQFPGIQQNRGEPQATCLAIATPDQDNWVIESNYGMLMGGCFDPNDNMASFMSGNEPHTFIGGEADYSTNIGPERMLYGQVLDPNITTIEVVMHTNMTLHEQVSGGGFIIPLPDSMRTCIIRAKGVKDQVIEQLVTDEPTWCNTSLGENTTSTIPPTDTAVAPSMPRTASTNAPTIVPSVGSEEIMLGDPELVEPDRLLRSHNFEYGYTGLSNTAGSYGRHMALRGRWIIVLMKIRNVGSEPVKIPDNFFAIRDAQGRVSRYDRAASSAYINRFGGTGPRGAGDHDAGQVIPPEQFLGTVPLLFDVSSDATDLVVFSSGNTEQGFLVRKDVR